MAKDFRDGVILPHTAGFFCFLFFYPSSPQDEALNGTGCEKMAAVWIDWNPKCSMKWLTWHWMGVNAVSSDFPPTNTVGRKSQVGDEAQTTQSFSAKVMDHTERLPSRKCIQMEHLEAGTCFICFTLLIFTLFCVVSCTVSIHGGQRIWVKCCTVAVLLTDALYVQSEATLGNSLLCVSHSLWAKCYTGWTVAHRTFVSTDAGICLTGATHGGCEPPKGGAPQGISSRLHMEKCRSGR